MQLIHLCIVEYHNEIEDKETYRRLEPVTDLTKRVLTTKRIRPKTFHKHITSLVGKKV
jgi:hypothetical protein